MGKEIELPVKFFRFSFGEDMISEVVEETSDKYTLRHPMRIIIDADLDAGKQTIYMTSWLPKGVMSNVDSCILNKKDILITGQLETDIENHYRSMAYDFFIEEQPLPKEKKEYVDEEKKVVSFTGKNSKSSKETKE